MWKKLKDRWKVDNAADVIIILVVFACTGFSVLYIKKLFFVWVGIGDHTPAWIRLCITLFIILPLYQVILLGWGWIFGKFNFFWEFEKKTFSRIRSMRKRKI
jgi:hypothetical protein